MLFTENSFRSCEYNLLAKLSDFHKVTIYCYQKLHGFLVRFFNSSNSNSTMYIDRRLEDKIKQVLVNVVQMARNRQIKNRHRINSSLVDSFAPDVILRLV